MWKNPSGNKRMANKLKDNPLILPIQNKLFTHKCQASSMMGT